MSTPHPAGDATRAERSACVSRKLAAEAALERVRPGLERGVSAAQAAAARADEAARQAGAAFTDATAALNSAISLRDRGVAAEDHSLRRSADPVVQATVDAVYDRVNDVRGGSGWSNHAERGVMLLRLRGMVDEVSALAVYAGDDLHEKLNALRREVGIVPLRATP